MLDDSRNAFLNHDTQITLITGHENTLAPPKKKQANWTTRRINKCIYFFQLNDETASIRKDPTVAEQNLIQANLYTNGKMRFYWTVYASYLVTICQP